MIRKKGCSCAHTNVGNRMWWPKKITVLIQAGKRDSILPFKEGGGLSKEAGLPRGPFIKPFENIVVYPFLML